MSNITDLQAWIPKYINQVLNDSTGFVVRPERWNELWNLAITQSDDQATYIKKIIDVLLAYINSLAQHAQSGDHDNRYYTQAKVDLDAGITQVQLNNLAVSIVNLQNQITALDATFATDAELATKLQQLTTALSTVDNNMLNLIAAKADTSAVYTKPQIDTMVLGYYKYKMLIQEDTLAPGSTTITFNRNMDFAYYDADNDYLEVYANGVLQSLGIDYSVAGDVINFTGGPFSQSIPITLKAHKNVRQIVLDNTIDGSLIQANTVSISKLNVDLRNEIQRLSNFGLVRGQQLTVDTPTSLFNLTASDGFVLECTNTTPITILINCNGMTNLGLRIHRMGTGSVTVKPDTGALYINSTGTIPNGCTIQPYGMCRVDGISVGKAFASGNIVQV